MTDKQIIIDGIDVTGCEYCSRYADTTIYHCDWIGECKEHPNCLYKQLKRAENQIVDLNKMVKAKEQECEELKKGLNLILTVQKNCKECPHQKLDVDVLVCDLDCATAFKKIAKQTLKNLENKNV